LTRLNENQKRLLVKEEVGLARVSARFSLHALWNGVRVRFTRCILNTSRHHGKNGFVTAAKSGTTNNFFVAVTKNFATATKRFVDRTKHFVVVTKYCCQPYFNKLFCWCNKTFYTVILFGNNSLYAISYMQGINMRCI